MGSDDLLNNVPGTACAFCLCVVVYFAGDLFTLGALEARDKCVSMGIPV
jgi:hypothetical protein